MKKRDIGKVDKIILNLIGIFFILLGVIGILNYVRQGEYQIILWFCYLGMILLGTGILKRNSFLIVSQLNILAIPLILWSIDYIYYLINAESLLGLAGYFFVLESALQKVISSQHVFTLPLALYALYRIGVKRKDAWKVSIPLIIGFYFASILFTSEALNINCVYRSCFSFSFPGPHNIMWFVSAFLMIFISNFILVKLFWKKK